VLVVGPNGAGKTNLLESLHVGTQGFSFRTRRESSAIRFDAPAARVSLTGTSSRDIEFSVAVTLTRAGEKQVTLNGAPVPSQEALRRELPTLAFTPDRLAVVKGPPAVRRAYLDRAIGRLFPARTAVSTEYAQALAQRNAALRRIRAGVSPRTVLEPWNDALVTLGGELDDAREAATGVLAPLFSGAASNLGLTDAAVAYGRAGLTAGMLAERLDRDLDRGTTGAGPHLTDLALTAAGRDLRTFGSQGQQRLALLALLLAEARAIPDLRGEPPLLLLDDVLSELDDRRRAALVADIPDGYQVIVTATSDRALPADGRPPDQTIDVLPGSAHSR
jgi:DNA replication and repair protein RecF